jgi:hypothetical protein
MPKKNAIYDRLAECDGFKNGEAVTADNFEDALSKLYPANLRKEMFRKTENPSDTLYRWWYDYLSAGIANHRLLNEIQSDAEENAAYLGNLEKFGDLKTDFLTWWQNGGKAAFSEVGVPKIRVVNGRLDQEQSRRDMGMMIIVPMNLPREGILEQINLALDVYHPGDDFRRHEHSSALLKIFPRQRATQTDYKSLLNVWLGAEAVISTGGKPIWWQIYCDAYDLGDTKLQLAKLQQEDIEIRDSFSKLARKMYKQANTLVKNSMIGKFPKDT